MTRKKLTKKKRSKRISRKPAAKKLARGKKDNRSRAQNGKSSSEWKRSRRGSVGKLRDKVMLPARPSATMLPLLDPNFSWERFEEFCHHLVSSLPGVKACNRYGSRGSDQKGIDL